MASGPKQLIEDYEQVQKLLETYPNIKIVNTQGDPPEQYDIEYTIKGYKIGPEGNAVPDNKHEVSISLPFGYPHFPPTAKPITPIFHPDIDPDAIRIADFWQENHSLSELIIHIGQMISGNHYTKEEPFNQSAFEWFEERKSWLPFDMLEPQDEDERAEEVATETEDAPPSSDEIEQALSQAVDLDILKDDIDFPFEEDEEIGNLEEEIDLDIGKTEVSEDLTALDEEPSEEFSFDFDEEGESADPFDLQETEEDTTDDIFSLDPEDDSDAVSFDLTDIEDEIEAAAEEPATDDLFQLETEDPATETQEETPLEFDSEDFSTAFEAEESTAADEPVAGVSLDDFEGLDEEEDALDFDITEETFDLEDEATADLSGLEEEAVADLSALEEELVEEITEEETPETEETAGDEDKILAALSLDEDFSSPGKAEEQSEVIRSLIDQKQIFSAKKVLTDLVEPDALSDKQELELTISGAVSEAEDLYKKADQHEKKGEFEKAGILLDLVANIAADFPGLEMARNRIRESIMSEGQKKPGETVEEKETVGAKEEKAPAEKPGKKKKKAHAKLPVKIPAKVLIIILFVLILGGIGTGLAYVYNNDLRSLKLARTSYQKAEQLVNRKEFKEAQKQLKTATSNLEKIFIFQGSEKEAITRKIKGFANSSVLKEGLKGRVLYGDQYYTVEVAKAIDKFNTHKSYAEQVLKAGKFEAAIAAYEKSIPYAEKAAFTEQVQSINRRIVELRLEMALTQATQLEEKQDWLGAADSYKNALEIGKSISTPREQKERGNKMDFAMYMNGLHEGSMAINESQWQKAIAAFQAVRKVVEGNPDIVAENERIEIDKLLVQSQLYANLAQAKESFEAQQWQAAIDKYSDTIGMLRDNTELLGQEAVENIKKIDKTILTTNVAREQAFIASTKTANELEKTVEHYEAIVTLIDNSEYKDDETLVKIRDDAKTQTTQIKNQLLITKREGWLLENYDKIFRDNYPSAKLSDLLNPKVRFVKREDNIMIFHMSCIERKQGSTFRLELYYQNDLDSGKWNLYAGTIEE